MANKTFSNWLASLAQAAVSQGDLIPVVQGGVSKRAPAGQAGGIATLDAAGKLAQPRRVLQVAVAFENATASTTGENVVASSPQVEITTISSNPVLIVDGWANMSVDGGGYANLAIAVDDGGGFSIEPNMWTYVPGGERNPLHAMAVLILSPGTYTIGMAFGNPSGVSKTVNLLGRRWLRVMEVDF